MSLLGHLETWQIPVYYGHIILVQINVKWIDITHSYKVICVQNSMLTFSILIELYDHGDEANINIMTNPWSLDSSHRGSCKNQFDIPLHMCSYVEQMLRNSPHEDLCFLDHYLYGMPFSLST